MKPQKTFIAFAWILALCMVLAACAAAPTTPANGENADDTSPETNEQDAADLEKIDVTCETDPALSQTTVIITNNAGRTFTGDVVAYLYDESNAIIGREDLHVQDLLPGYYAGYVIDVTGTNDVEVRYHINDGYMFTGEVSADDQGSDGDTSTETPAASVPTFSISVDSLMDVLAANLADGDLPDITQSEPTDSEYDDGTIAHSYNVTTGVSLGISEEKATGNLTSIFLFGTVDQMDTDDAKIMGGYCALLSMLFAKDDADLDNIETKLDIVNSGLSTDVINVCCGDVADFSYIVNSGTAMLQITPPVQ